MSAKRDAVQKITKPKSALGKWVRRAFSLLMMVCFISVLAVGGLFIRVKSGPLALPGVQKAVSELAKRAVSDFDIEIGGVSLVAAEQGINVLVQLTDLQIFTKTGQKIAEFPVVRAKLDPVKSILEGVEVETIEIIGAEFRVLRDRNGKYNILPPGNDDTGVIKPEMIFAAANVAAKKSPLRNLRLIDIIDTNLVYIDLIKSRVWTTSKTHMQSIREGDVITATADVVMRTNDRADTSAGLRFSYGLGDDFFGFGFKFDHASTVDLADQVPALDWLRSFDAEVTGSINAEVKIDGALDRLSGVLETEKGQLRDSPDAEPIKFSNVKTYFEYAKETDSLNFTQITAKSAVGEITGEGAIVMFRDPSGAVSALSGSVALSELQIHPEGVFAQPLKFDRAKANVHMTLSPFSITLEDAELTAGDLKLSMTGSSVAGDKYWNSSYVMRFNEVRHDQVMSFWPLKAKKKTRDWIEKNVLDGVAKNGIGQLHSHNGKASIDLKFDLAQGKIRYLKTLPVLQGAVGRGHLTEKMFRAELYEGFVITPDNTRIDVSNTSFTVPDLTVKPATGDVTLNVKGGLQAALSMLDEKPFEFLKKANLKPTLGTGDVVASGVLSVPLVKGTKPEDVKFQVTAEIRNLLSKTLVKNRTVSAETVMVHANDRKVELSGEIELDGISTQTQWILPIGKKRVKQSELISDVKLNAANLRQLGVQFEEGIISGEAPARLRVILKPKQAPKYTLTSDMVGLGLNIKALNWAKPKASKGKLSASGTLGENFTLDSFAVNTAGLTAKGAIQFNADNSFKQADFTNLTVGNWLNAVASLEGSGGKISKITLSSGTVDLRNARFAKDAKGGAPMDVALDRLILSDGIVLTGLRAKLRNEQGLRGTFGARVNGGAVITGKIFPQKNGTAAEVNAVDAGAVLRSAKLYTKGSGGKLRMMVLPLAKEGQYKGSFVIKKARVKQDNVLAGLLNAISGIGLVQQLSGEGIVFEKIDGQFTLKPQGVELRKVSAVGVSIGITMDGNYNSKTKGVNFEGVLTPLYAVNGTLVRVFGKILGRRKGEGVFSFVYNMTGPADNPQIKVNPFSILTPGVFREVFRTKIPDVGKADIPAVPAPAAIQKETENPDRTDTLAPEADR